MPLYDAKQYDAVLASVCCWKGNGRNLLKEKSCQISSRSDVKRRTKTFLKRITEQEAQEQDEEEEEEEDQ